MRAWLRSEYNPAVVKRAALLVPECIRQTLKSYATLFNPKTTLDKSQNTC